MRPHRSGCVVFLVDRLFPGLAIAQSEAPIALVPENSSWRSLPQNPALESAWVLGDGTESLPYILRVKLAAGGRIPPHTHPDERNSTVLQGVLYIVFGKTFDGSKVIAIRTGAVCVIPPKSALCLGQGRGSHLSGSRRGHHPNHIHRSSSQPALGLAKSSRGSLREI